jgi:hypothetical protein
MRERIKLLAGQFLQRCSGDVVTLHALLTPMGNGDAKVFDARVFGELEHLAHRICGTGAPPPSSGWRKGRQVCRP